MTTSTQARTTFGDVFAVAEFRALWLAQVLSVTGDQLARVALTVLVYDRTRSPLLAAVTFAASVVPTFIGGLMLSGLADRLPRRRVMIGADLASGVVVTAMVLPGVPLAVLIMLLFAVTMVGALFLAARAAIYPEILDGDRYAVGTALTMTTVLSAQVVGFAVGGAAVAFLGVRISLLADAATFGASAIIIRARIHARPVPAAPLSAAPRHHPAAARRPGRGRHARPGPVAGSLAGVRLVFGNHAMRTPMLFGWLCAFYELPQGVAIPLAREASGGTVTIGLILAAQALGSVVGSLGFSRLVGTAQRVKWTGALAIGACASLISFAADPGLPCALLVLAASGLFGCYQLAANASFVQATPPAHRGQAFGIAQGGISLGQGAAITLAGAASQYISPATVIAAAGGLGALCALALTITTRTAGRRRETAGARGQYGGDHGARRHRGNREAHWARRRLPGKRPPRRSVPRLSSTASALPVSQLITMRPDVPGGLYLLLGVLLLSA